jgi:hypothetical protein
LKNEPKSLQGKKTHLNLQAFEHSILIPPKYNCHQDILDLTTTCYDICNLGISKYRHAKTRIKGVSTL